MKPWLTVLTCPRRRASYLAATIASLDRAGAQELDAERVIFVDGDASGIEFPGWRACPLQTPCDLGVKEACFLVLRTAARAGVPFLIFCEDDIELARNAIPAIARMPVPDSIGFLSFCDIKEVAAGPGITVAPGYDYRAVPGYGGHWGNQCLKIPGASLQRLLRHHIADWTQWRRASDILLGMFFDSYGIFSPSLVQHTGDVSLVQDPIVTLDCPGRLSKTFPGVDFDALSIDPSAVQLHIAATIEPRCLMHGIIHEDGGGPCPRTTATPAAF